MKAMKNIPVIIILLMVIFTSCTERVDIDLEDTFTRLVVEGNLTTDTAVHFVKLSTTSSYYDNQEPPPVENAVVTITDDEGEFIQLVEVAPGVYSTGRDYFAEIGKTYTLDIMLEEEINGFKDYQAVSSVPPMYPIDSISLGFQPEWGEEGFVEVKCYYQDRLSRDFFMFNIYKNGILLTDTITKRFVTDDEFFNGGYTNGIGVGWLNQADEREKVSAGDIITFQAASITEEYANFIWTLQEEVGFSAPLFSGPPANVKSNVSNGAVGFFAAYSVEYAKTAAEGF
jgi:hypothetical protein